MIWGYKEVTYIGWDYWFGVVYKRMSIPGSITYYLGQFQQDIFKLYKHWFVIRKIMRVIFFHGTLNISYSSCLMNDRLLKTSTRIYEYSAHFYNLIPYYLSYFKSISYLSILHNLRTTSLPLRSNEPSLMWHFLRTFTFQEHFWWWLYSGDLYLDGA